MTELWPTLRFAARRLRKERGPALASVILLALGIGGVLAIFGPLYSLVLAPLPFPKAGQLVEVGGVPVFSVYTARIPQRAALSPIFSGLAAYWPETAQSGPQVTAVTPEFFSTLGVAPRLGRDFRKASENSGLSSLPSAIVSWNLWHYRLHRRGPPDGVPVSLAGSRQRVVGVMPPRFDFPAGTQVWELAPRNGGAPGPAGGLVVFGRLRGGLALRAATARLRAIATYTPGIGLLTPSGPTLMSLHDALAGNRRSLLWLLFGAAILLLLLTCAGVANATLARTVRRWPQILLARALGASWAAVAVEYSAETAILAAAGAVGAALGEVTLRPAIRAAASQALGHAAYDTSSAHWVAMMAAAVGLGVVAAVACSVPVALRIGKSNASQYLKQCGSGIWASPGPRRGPALQEGLAMTQLAIAFALLAATALLVGSIAAHMQVPVGFNPARVVLAHSGIEPTPAIVAANEALQRGAPGWEKSLSAALRVAVARDGPIIERATAALARLPEVAEMGHLAPAPFSRGGVRAFGILRDGPSPSPLEPDYTPALQRRASANAFRVLGIRLLTGRLFSSADIAAQQHVTKLVIANAGRWPAGILRPVIVNQRLASEFWPGRNPLGRVFYAPVPSRVVGVVANIHESTAPLDVLPTVYTSTPGGLSFIIKLHPGASRKSLTRAVMRIWASLPAVAVLPPTVTSMKAQIARSWAELSLISWLLAGFAVIGGLVAALGVYGNAAALAATKIHEIGVRLALGAGPARIRRMVLWRSLRLALLSLPVAVLLEWVLARGLSHWLFGLGSRDLPAYLVAALMVCGLVVAASLAPALRAADTDPAAVLRDCG
ncbi:MAG: ABC transporter permease [Terriglobales bacterium]